MYACETSEGKSPFVRLKCKRGHVESNFLMVHVCLDSREKREEQKHWCPTCQTHFTSSVTDHRRTEEHKVITCRQTYISEKGYLIDFLLFSAPQHASRAIVSSCTICKKHFRSSQVFVEHLQSLEHRQKVEKVLVFNS